MQLMRMIGMVTVYYMEDLVEGLELLKEAIERSRCRARARYKDIAIDYPMFSIEDAFHSDDMEFLTSLIRSVGYVMLVVRDYNQVSDPKVGQVGPVTECIEAVRRAKDARWFVGMESHDSGLNGTFIADLSVALSLGLCKIGISGQNYERRSVYYRIYQIETEIVLETERENDLEFFPSRTQAWSFDMQTVGKDVSCTLRSETRFRDFRKHYKATAGVSVTLLGDSLSAGVKVEDKLIANKRFRVLVTGGAVTGQGDVAYGGSLEARILVGRHTNLGGRANMNDRGGAQVSIRLNSSEQLQLAFAALIPILRRSFAYLSNCK